MQIHDLLLISVVIIQGFILNLQTKKFCSNKVLLYFDFCAGGPYWMQCGSDGSYLRCEEELLKKVKNKAEASEFRIMEKDDPKCFSIAYRRSVDRDYHHVNSSRSLSTDVRVNCSGSRLSFSLSHKMKPKENLSVAMWKSTFCSVKLNQMNFRGTYLGWSKADPELLSMKTHDSSESFKLVKVPISDSG